MTDAAYDAGDLLVKAAAFMAAARRSARLLKKSI